MFVLLSLLMIVDMNNDKIHGNNEDERKTDFSGERLLAPNDFKSQNKMVGNDCFGPFFVHTVEKEPVVVGNCTVIYTFMCSCAPWNLGNLGDDLEQCRGNVAEKWEMHHFVPNFMTKNLAAFVSVHF